MQSLLQSEQRDFSSWKSTFAARVIRLLPSASIWRPGSTRAISLQSLPLLRSYWEWPRHNTLKQWCASAGDYALHLAGWPEQNRNCVRIGSLLRNQLYVRAPWRPQHLEEWLLTLWRRLGRDQTRRGICWKVLPRCIVYLRQRHANILCSYAEILSLHDWGNQHLERRIT